jgi:phospholipase/carboxylesterase/glyoxalase family protein
VATEARDLVFTHRFIPAGGSAARPTLLLLHGTGGNEDDLLPLGRELAPNAALLAPRGRVLERGMPRFFRRLAEGVFDQQDLALRTDELAAFIAAAATEYRFDAKSVIAVGYSNGANIAASVLLKHPGVLAGAVLFHPMVPFEPSPLPKSPETPVFMSAGIADAMVPRELTERLAELLRDSGATVTVHWERGGHELARSEVDAARAWLSQTFPLTP